MKEKLAFLESNRFWALVIGALSVYLQAKGIIGEAEMALIATLSAGFVTIRTVDRIGDKKVEAAKGVTTVSVPDNVSKVTTTTTKKKKK